jgi:cytochrome c peroxidase
MAGAGCSSSGDDHDGFSSTDWKAVTAMQPLATPIPRNPYNKRDMDMNVIKFGQKLFYDVEYSEAITVDGNPAGKKGDVGKVSCASCHDPKGYFVDNRVDPTTNARFATSPALGVPGRRQTPGMLNEAYYEWIGWTGRHDSLIMHGAGVAVFVSSQLTLAHHIYKKYKDEYNGLFPDNKLPDALDPMAPDAARFPPSGKPKAMESAPDGNFEKLSAEDQAWIFQFMYNMARVWDTYPRALVTHDSPFEKYVAGDFTALSPEAKRGLKLFIGKAACNDCHTGPTLTDNEFHNIGVAQPMGAMSDPGRMADLLTTMTNRYNGASMYSDDQEAGKKKLATLPKPDSADWMKMNGQFRTPTLLNIAETYPYFHTGQLRTLEEVVQHYNKGGEETGFAGPKDPKLKPLNLTDGEVADLVSFLKSLTGVVDLELTKDIRGM